MRLELGRGSTLIRRIVELVQFHASLLYGRDIVPDKPVHLCENFKAGTTNVQG